LRKVAFEAGPTLSIFGVNVTRVSCRLGRVPLFGYFELLLQPFVFKVPVLDLGGCLACIALPFEMSQLLVEVHDRNDILSGRNTYLPGASRLYSPGNLGFSRKVGKEEKKLKERTRKMKRKKKRKGMKQEKKRK
jgi:hypothetical protein